jgi:hypothetical protein
MSLLQAPIVKVFTAGSHFAGDQKPSESSSILETMLIRSGYAKGYEWECRVDKMRHCSAESRPVRIIGFKNYGVIMRVKPNVNATLDYQMTLLIPEGSGYSAKNLFDQLKANEKSVSRWVRQTEKQERQEEPMHTILTPPYESTPHQEPMTPMVSSNGHAAPVIEEDRPEFKTLQGVVKNHDKLKYVLSKIQAVDEMDFCRNKAQFTETVKHECKWDKEGHTTGAVSRVLTELVKCEYLMELVNERDKIIGFTLSDEGKDFLLQSEDIKPATKVIKEVAPKKEEPKVNIPGLLVDLRDKLQELADVASKITSNNLEKEEILKKLAFLDRENEELSKILHQNKESQDVLNKLGALISPLPMRGAK